jgi:hypothetical protein
MYSLKQPSQFGKVEWWHAEVHVSEIYHRMITGKIQTSRDKNGSIQQFAAFNILFNI